MLVTSGIARSLLAAVAVTLLSVLATVSKPLAQSTLPPMPAADAPIIDYQNRYLPAYGRAGMVVSPEKLAGEIGLDMLKQGGNAVDAAVATGFALAVTLPRAGNIGGGGFMLIHLAETDEQIFIDYRETAPAAATRDMFASADDGLPASEIGPLAVAVPGMVAGRAQALKKWGTMPLAQVVAPARDTTRSARA